MANFFRYSLRGALLGSTAVLSLATPVSAQTADPAPQAEAESVDVSDGEIFVTARKRNERIQDVPVAITALNSDAITRANATSLIDLNGLAPNVSLQNFAIFPFNLTAVIRGIGTADFEPSSDPAVALFIDGVYQPSSNGAAVGLLDTESVEVLRGPQGTLFGRNATAGAILIRSKRPQQTLGMELQGTIGNYRQHTAAAAVSGPLIEGKVAARLSLSTDNSDGYFKNYDGRRVGDKEVYAIRPSLLITPNENLDIFISGEYVRDVSDTIPGVDGGSLFSPGTPGADRGDYNTTSNEDLTYRSTAKSITLNADYRTDPGTFTLIANHRTFKYFGNFDVDASALTVLAVDRDEKHKQSSVEGRFSSSFDGPFSFVAGGSYAMHDYDLQFIGRSAVLVAALIPGIQLDGPGIPIVVTQNTQKSDNYSLYFQGTYKFSEALSVDVGLNYGHEKKVFDFNNLGNPVSKSWGNLGPKVGLNFKASQDVLVYASYSRGFRSGGFSGRATDVRNIGPYDPEKVDAFEIGLKSDLFDRTLRFNLSAFYNKFKDLQRPFPNLTGFNGTPPSPTELITFNAAGANIKGVELETTWRPIDGLTLQGNVAYLDAEYDGFINPFTGVSSDNLKLVYAPKWNTRVAAIYHVGISEELFAEASADYEYTSRQFTDNDNSGALSLRRPTNIVNASLSIGQEDGPLKVTGFVKNLTKEVYVVSSQIGTPIFNIFTLNAPRTYGLTLHARF